MLVAVSISVLGFLTVASVTQVYGYRLGGTIVVPILAVYTLKNFAMLPVYVLSTILATLGLAVLKQRTLVYGRDELIAAILVGSIVPVTILLTFGTLVDDTLFDVVFIGSILPGLAAYNYHQLDAELRRWDVIYTVVLFCCLSALGWLLVSPSLADPLAALTPPVLYADTSDVAVLKGVAVDTVLSPPILPRAVTVGLFAVGMILAERIRDRYAVRTGVVATALLAIYSLADVSLLFLYVVALVVVFALVQALHHLTLLYGRVLIGVGCAVGVVFATLLVEPLAITRGLSAYFVGVLGGINAYNLHVTRRGYRRLFVPLQLGSLAVLLPIARASGVVLPGGFPRRFGVPELFAAAVVAALCLLVVERFIPDRPPTSEVFDASILARVGLSAPEETAASTDSLGAELSEGE